MERMERGSAEKLAQVLTVVASVVLDSPLEKPMVRRQVQGRIWEAPWREWTRMTTRRHIVCFGWWMRLGSRFAADGFRRGRALRGAACKRSSVGRIAARQGHIKTRWLLRHAVYVTVAIRGNMRAGLVDKCLPHADVLEEGTDVFFQESHSADPWLHRFQIARMAKLGSGEPLSRQMTRIEIGLSDYVKTPAKRAREEVIDVDESPTWVDVESDGIGFEAINISWTPLAPQEEINERARLNFEVLKWETIRASGIWSDALKQVRDSMQQLIGAQSQTEIRVGDPGALGASVGVMNAFDGLRHLMELLDHAEQKFTPVPYP
jgi:hypothetical protein